MTTLNLRQIRLVISHYGPGPHPGTGTGQEVHASQPEIKPSPTAFLVRMGLEELPPAHVDGLATVDFVEQRFIRSLDPRGSVVEAYGTYDPRKREIVLASNADNIKVYGGGTLVHEVGHHVHLARMTDEGADAWADLSRGGQSAFISAYAQTNEGEHFAEAYRAYYKSPESRKKLKALEPHSYRFMRNLNKYLLPVGQLANPNLWVDRYQGWM